jgi:hypothetical protein
MVATVSADNGSVSGSAGIKLSSDSSGVLALQSGANTTAVTIDTSQNVGIGTTSPVGKVYVSGANTTNLGVSSTNALNLAAANGALIGRRVNLGFAVVDSATNAAAAIALEYTNQSSYGYGDLLFATRSVNTDTAPSERMRIDSSGNLLVGTTDTGLSSGVGTKFIYSATQPYMGMVVNVSANSSHYHLYNTNATNNGYRFIVYANGGISNFSANNSNLSDQREKKDIELAPNYLNKICQIPVKTFLFNDQGDADLNLGVIAQDVQSVAPELVMESNWGTEEEPKMRLSIYQTDLQYALMKSIQELKAINDTQAETINALTARVAALEAK